MKTRNRGEVEFRATSFALSDMTRYGYTGLRNIGPAVSEDAAKGLPALYRAARLRSEAIATLRLCCWRGYGPDREKVTQNVWQALLFGKDRYNDYQTRFAFWEAVEESLAWRNVANIFKLTDPLNGRVVELWALHPDQVKSTDDGYEVTVMQGYLDPIGRGPGKYEVGEDAVLRIRGHGEGGKLDPPTPIQLFKEALSGPIGRQKHENRMWRRGAALQVAVEFPPGITPAQAGEWKDQWRATYEGIDGETTGVVGDGATIKPIGMTPADAQFVDMAKLTVHDASRIMGVPANLLGVQTERPVPNLEQDLATWLRFGLGPECARIESALGADDDLFGATPPNASSVYPEFDTEMFVRGDIKTEAQVLAQLVQVGILTPNEARRLRGLDDIPGGDIPQITPVGGAPNPVPMPVGSSNGNSSNGADPEGY